MLLNIFLVVGIIYLIIQAIKDIKEILKEILKDDNEKFDNEKFDN